MSSLESWSSSYEKSESEARQMSARAGVQSKSTLGILEDVVRREDTRTRKAATQPLASQPLQDLESRFESRPEIVERAEHVVCQPRPAERVLAAGQYHSSEQEVFRVLCQRLRRVREQRPLRTILITSAVPDEGKTVVATNVAATLAHNSPQVLLVDADLRHPAAPALGLSPRGGLADFLSGRIELPQAICRVDPLGFYYLSAGRSSMNPAELLQKPALQEFMGQAAAAFDWVIFDSPSVNLFAEARHLALLVDGVLLVVREGVTPREAAEKSLGALEGAFVVGLVFNASTNALHDRYDLTKSSAVAALDETGPSAGRMGPNGKKPDYD